MSSSLTVAACAVSLLSLPAASRSHTRTVHRPLAGTDSASSAATFGAVRSPNVQPVQSLGAVCAGHTAYFAAAIGALPLGMGWPAQRERVGLAPSAAADDVRSSGALGAVLSTFRGDRRTSPSCSLRPALVRSDGLTPFGSCGCRGVNRRSDSGRARAALWLHCADCSSRTTAAARDVRVRDAGVVRAPDSARSISPRFHPGVVAEPPVIVSRGRVESVTQTVTEFIAANSELSVVPGHGSLTQTASSETDGVPPRASVYGDRRNVPQESGLE